MPRSVSSFVLTCIATAVVVLPLLVIPYTGVAPVVQKGMLFAFLLGAALCALAIEIFVTKRSIHVPDSFVLLGFPILIVASVSFLFSGAHVVSLAGNSFELGTVGSFMLFSGALVAGASLSSRAAEYLLHLFVGTMILTTSFSVASIFLTPELFGGATLVGSWTELSFLIAGALMVAVSFADGGENVRLRMLYIVLSSILCACLVLFFDRSSVLLSLFFLVCIAVWRSRAFFTNARTYSLPWAAYIGVACIAVLLLLGVRAPVLPLEPVGKPSLRATELVAIPAILENAPRALLGTGPRTFSQVWDKYRPVEFNATPYWDAIIPSAYSTLLTFAVTLGVFGLIAFLLLPTALIVRMSSVFARTHVRHAHDVYYSPILASGALALFSYAASFLYPMELTLFLVGGLATGLCISLCRVGELLAYNPKQVVVRMLLAVTILAFGALLLGASSFQLLAAWHHARGVRQVTVDIREASSSLVRAANIWPTSLYERDASRALLIHALGLTPKFAEDTEYIRQQIKTALGLADHSLYTNPDDLSTLLSRAFLYIQLSPNGFEGATDKAKDSLERAESLASTRPDVFYLQAGLAIRQGNTPLAHEYLEKALRLKPDYKNALELLQALERTP